MSITSASSTYIIQGDMVNCSGMIGHGGHVGGEGAQLSEFLPQPDTVTRIPPTDTPPTLLYIIIITTASYTVKSLPPTSLGQPPPCLPSAPPSFSFFRFRLLLARLQLVLLWLRASSLCPASLPSPPSVLIIPFPPSTPSLFPSLAAATPAKRRANPRKCLPRKPSSKRRCSWAVQETT